MTSSVRVLSLADAVELAHALAVTVADDAGARVLVIKGPTAAHHGLREPRISSDADVWVDPASRDAYLAALAECGWEERVTSEGYHDLVGHSVTLIHPEWPCDIDVHDAFPGFLADPQQVFDEFWDGREYMELAGASAPIVARDAAILIAALHALRTPAQTARHGHELRRLVSGVVPTLSFDDRAALVALAGRTGASDTARPLLEHLEVELPDATPYGANPQLDAWRARTGGHGSVMTQWAIKLRQVQWRERPALIARIVWPPERDFRLDHPEVPDGKAALTRARWARIGRGVKSFPSTVRGRWLARRGITDDSLLREDQP